jgi:purine-binding chemotaxis protein CheW
MAGSVTSEIAQLVVFRLGERRYALPLAVVERVVRAVDVTPLPKAPPIVLGAIDVHGRVLPVLNVRRRFRMPDREIGPSDWFLLAHTGRRTVVLVVDESEGVVERPQAEIVLSTQIAPGLEPFPGVLRLDDGLVLIHDLETFLSLDEARALDEAMDETSVIVQP